ncbi:MAG: hypothetical protein HOE90_00050 [Bacteriovoracaceae bacterium]|nr:hypothetical protein [Bacteriovoracaceae bacterium]
MIKIVMKINIIMILVMVFTACLPSSPSKGRKKIIEEDASTAASPTDFSDTTSDQDELYWYSNATYSEAEITINQDIKTEIYLKGTRIHNYLKVNSNDLKTYCVVSTYSLTDPSKKEQYRIRAVPVAFNNIDTGILEYALRLDVHDDTVNSAACTGDTTSLLDNVTSIDDATDVAFKPSDVCTDCSGILTSDSVIIYNTTSNAMSDSSIIETTSLDFSELTLKIDILNSSTNTGGTCTNSECQAQGYNCCVNGQCVNDGDEKPGSTTHTDYTQSQTDIAINAANFILYPEIYYVCGSGTYATPTATTPPDVDATSAAYQSGLIEQYQCLNESAQAAPTPFCGIATYTPSYSETVTDIKYVCGCDATPTASYPDDPATACPDYLLKVTLNDGTVIKDRVLSSSEIAYAATVECYVPDTGADPTPFQNLELAVNNRRAPARMFLDDGTPVADIADYYETPVVAEGTPFMYLDENNKTLPDGTTFNMNSITGQFDVNLTQALPAILINVDYDAMYTIAAIDGYSTPCLTCARDSWFSAFTAYPESQMGGGLQAVGNSTERDGWGDNINYGNYEDTVFGRACWLPPTMIPFSHNPHATSVQTQRQDRKQTQAAFWINGYQRDWWGFNKNALLGSFDGSTWFAIGKGRRVRATSSKLWLAINTPYSDLAEPTDITVQVLADDALNTVSEYDYDPDLTYNHPEQNSAGTCQQYHMCNVDSDCITKLGWEYFCADVSKYKTLWPDYDSSADEDVNDSKTFSIGQILKQQSIVGGTNYRCVYRGSGAPCKIDYTTDSNGTANAGSERDRKAWSCAPNFHCEDVDNSTFNRSINREKDALNTILFGQQAPVLGRPAMYVADAYSLPTEVVTNMKANATPAGIPDTNLGMCRPGKDLTDADQRVAHQSSDSSGRADYISQIASCDIDASTIATNIVGTGNTGKARTRVASCPLLDSDGNYYYQDDDYDTMMASSSIRETLQNQSRARNTCASQAQHKTTSTSAFDSIEGDTLSNILGSGGSIFEPSMVKNACLRRAGSVCHTNLDCYPNKLHSEIAETKSYQDYFGGNEGERKFFEEYLVCGQAQTPPYYTSDDYFDYDITKNKCCREVGNSITLFTEGASDSASLETDKLSDLDANADNRYSRYTTYLGAKAYPSPTPSLSNADYNWPKTTAGSVTETSLNQWKVISDTAKRTCCGGGWVRKFSDGGHDWSKTDRVRYSVSDFQCLNYNNTIAIAKPSAVPSQAYDRSRDALCYDPLVGCIQPEFLGVSDTSIMGPADNASETLTISNWVNPSSGEFNFITDNAPHYLLSAEADNATYLSVEVDSLDGVVDIVPTGTDRHALKMWIPSFVNGCDAIDEVGISVKVYDNSNSYNSSIGTWVAAGVWGTAEGGGNQVGIFCFDDSDARATDISDPADCPDPGSNDSATVCYDFETSTDTGSTNGKMIMKIRTASPVGGTERYYTEFTFDKPGTTTWPYDYSPGPLATDLPAINIGMTPGYPVYYLLKFGKFELKGIPQIVYEPLYCNSDKEQMVPGLFKSPGGSAITTRTVYENDAFVEQITNDDIYKFPVASSDSANPSSFMPGGAPGTDAYVNLQDMIATDTVFSEYEFLCCMNLGETTADPNNCCSAHGVDDGTGVYTCKLPNYTDLSVYFNRYVSGDGEGSEQPGGGLEEDDFDPLTGEPKIYEQKDTDSDGTIVTRTDEAFNKLIALGEEYCESGTVQTGGAFGSYDGEPFPSSTFQITENPRYSIVDSPLDYQAPTGSDETRGYGVFSSGARWNHHIYCAP